jgi:hypothetical protein
MGTVAPRRVLLIEKKRVRWPAQEKMEVRRRGVLTGEDGGDDFVWLDGARR